MVHNNSNDDLYTTDLIGNVPIVSSIDEVLEVIRKHSWIIGEKKLTNFFSFLSGFSYGAKCWTLHNSVLGRFDEWLKTKFPDETVEGWYPVIASVAKSDAEGFEMFWNLYDEFQNTEEEVERDKGA